MPIISFFLLLLSAAIEILYRVMKMDDLPIAVSVVNWIFLVFFLIITFLHKRWTVLHAFVCPCLTILTYLYLCEVDYDFTLASCYYAMIVGLTLAFFIMIIFNENWIFSTITFAPSLILYMNQTGYDLIGLESVELALRSCFCVVAYAILAYRTENSSK